tara:strand:+ start:123 stop:593 length:471 start_codon:yes stop_codon:yes gene_type:complete
MKRSMIVMFPVGLFLSLVSSVSLAHPTGQSIDIPCSVTYSGGYDGGGYGHLSFLLSAPISAKLRKLHKLDETAEGRHKWRVRAKVPLIKGGDATFVGTIHYRVNKGGRVFADSATYLNLIALSAVKKEEIKAFEKKVELMKGNFGPFPSAKCELLK